MTDPAPSPLTRAQVACLVEQVGGRDRALAIISGDLKVACRDAEAPGSAPPGTPTTTIERTVTVPAQQDYEQRIAHGRYGWRHEGLTEACFPVTADQAGTVRQKLFHFDRNVSSGDADRLIRDAGYEPARIADILVFGEMFPDVQRLHPVVGLGSIAEIDGKRSAPTLWFDGARRTLDVLWLDGDWHRNYRFLAVRPDGDAAPADAPSPTPKEGKT